jgi:hypothetical protein
MGPKHIYEDCSKQWQGDPEHVGEGPPSLGLLRSVLGHELKGQFHQPKEGDWGLCAVCQLLQIQAQEPGLVPQLQAQLREAQERHNAAQQVERVVLEEHKADVEAHPEKKNLVGVDQTKSLGVPHCHPTNTVIVHLQIVGFVVLIAVLHCR